MGPVLVTDGHKRAALSVVRALGRANIACIVGATKKPTLAMWSRYCGSSVLLPDPRREPDRFAAAVAQEAKGRGAKAVMPSSDAALRAISQGRDYFTDDIVRTFPPADALARTLDRTALHDLADTLSIKTAKRLTISKETGLEPVLREAAKLAFPMRIWVRPVKLEAAAATVRVNSIAALRTYLYENEPLLRFGATIDPASPGRAIAYGTVVHDGHFVGELFREQMREHRRLSGKSTASMTIEPIEGVREAAQKLLLAIGWRGPALVRFAVDGSEIRLVEVVARVWDSVQLAIDAGFNVPLLSLRTALGMRDPQRMALAKPGVSLRWLMGDLDRALLLALGNEALGIGDRLRGAGALLALPFVRTRSDVFDKSDPLPFIFEVQRAAKSVGHSVSDPFSRHKALTDLTR